MSAFADLVRFVPTLGGTTDWTFSSAVGGCQSPSAAGVVNGISYKVYAVSADLTQWEVSTGVYSSGTGTFPRTTVLSNVSGTGTLPGQSGAGTKISFSTVPQVSIVALAEDLMTTVFPQGRLTLTSGLAVMTSSVTGATSVLYTPSGGNMVPIFNGTSFVPTAFAELSQATTDTTKSPAAVAANSNYDVFVWNDSGTIRATRGPPWSSNTTRGTGAGTSELVNVNGLPLNANAITNGPAAQRGTYVGTIHSNATSTIDFLAGGSGSGGVAGSMNVWNMYNRALGLMSVIDSGASYTYASGTVRQARASAGNQASFVVGLIEDAIDAAYTTRIDTGTSASNFGEIAITLDGILQRRVFIQTPTAAVQLGSPLCAVSQYPSLGYHTYGGAEASSGTTTFNSDTNATLTVKVWC